MAHAEERIYILMRNLETLIFNASPEYKLLATNPFDKGEQANSSLVISNGQIFIRTFKNLWCLEPKR